MVAPWPVKTKSAERLDSVISLSSVYLALDYKGFFPRICALPALPTFYKAEGRCTIGAFSSWEHQLAEIRRFLLFRLKIHREPCEARGGHTDFSDRFSTLCPFYCSILLIYHHYDPQLREQCLESPKSMLETQMSNTHLVAEYAPRGQLWEVATGAKIE